MLDCIFDIQVSYKLHNNEVYLVDNNLSERFNFKPDEFEYSSGTLQLKDNEHISHMQGEFNDHHINYLKIITSNR